MNPPAIEIEPEFYLLIHLPGGPSVQQVRALRKVGPEGASNVSASQFLAQLRYQQNVLLGPYFKKYLAARAKAELEYVGLTVELQAT